VIGRRAKRRSGRDDGVAPSEFGSEPEGPLFKLDELQERRIHTWSPEPEEDPYFELVPERQEPEPAAPAREAPAPRPAEAARTSAPATPARRPAAPAAEPAPTAPRPERETESTTSSEPAPAPRRGRPRGRPRRQVHFHVDPDEERLLMEAVDMYGSQQKGLVAALRSLRDNARLRAEIARLEEECERQRQLLERAESLFKG
jgi:hypothetical protein